MTPPEERPSRAGRVYGALLRLYPPSFRARFEADMRATFARDRDHARSEGVGARAAFWIRAIAEAVRFGVAERIAPPSRSVTTPLSSGGAPMSSRLAVDWRDAWRALRATPVVTLMAVLSLALGIGANTALFSILNSLVLRTLPVRAPEQLTLLLDGSWPNPVWEQIRDRQKEIGAGAFVWSTVRFDLAPRGETDPIDAAYASGGMFDVLGLSAARGRLFTPADDVRGGPAVAVVSYGFWLQRLGGRDDAVGRTITLDRVPFVIIGVMPRGFTGPDVGRACEVIVPLGSEPLVRAPAPSWLDGRSTWWLEMMVRLRPGQTVEQANAALRARQPQIREATMPPDYTPQLQPQYLKEPLTLAPAATGRSGLRTRFQQPLVAMMVVVGAVLLIACANIANLMLARANARRRDLTVRLALGASRARIARQLICESLLIAGAGAGLGLAAARLGASFLVAQLPANYLDTSIDLRVLAFTAGIGLVTALVFGTVPALGAAALSPSEALKDQGRDDRRRSAARLPQSARGRAGRAVAGARRRGRPLRPHVSVAQQRAARHPRRAAPRRHSRSPAEPDARGRRHRTRTGTAPALRAAPRDRRGRARREERGALARGAPHGRRLELAHRPGGRRERPAGIRPPWLNGVTPGWFQTHGLRVVAGRDLSPGDRLGGPVVAVVNEAFVRRYFQDQSPIGQHFKPASRTASGSIRRSSASCPTASMPTSATAHQRSCTSPSPSSQAMDPAMIAHRRGGAARVGRCAAPAHRGAH